MEDQGQDEGEESTGGPDEASNDLEGPIEGPEGLGSSSEGPEDASLEPQAPVSTVVWEGETTEDGGGDHGECTKPG